MAKERLRFTDFYVAQAVCSASRAALLTGCYPNRIGIQRALGPNSVVGIHRDETTLLVKQPMSPRKSQSGSSIAFKSAIIHSLRINWERDLVGRAPIHPLAAVALHARDSHEPYRNRPLNRKRRA